MKGKSDDTVWRIKAETSGKVFATSYCNIHGLWEDAKELEVK